jgi:xylulose-5-phosphate/fructose-6-phosphate phosphoketolase
MKNETKPADLNRTNTYWRAAYHISAGQLYLLDNPLLKKPLELSHVKANLPGHR